MRQWLGPFSPQEVELMHACGAACSLMMCDFPAQEIITPDGTKIPCGTPIHNQEVIDKGTELMYNEYVVYDTSQVWMHNFCIS